MASSYPSGLDSLTDPLPGDSTVTVSHAAQHGNANDAIEAIQSTLGVNPQGASASVAARCAALESGKAALSGATFSGAVSVTNATDSSSSTTGSLKTAGGLGVAKAVNIGTTLAVTGASTFSGDVTISKATPVITASASSTTTASFYLDNASSGSYGRFLFRVGGARRWDFGRDGTAESGANAGSDFYLTAYSDAGSGIGTWLAVRRADGKTTLGGAGASAGLELGSLGPRIMSGTGSPEGVVTAPVNSQWLQSDSTVGAFRWRKASGTGNTGWVVADGDTGWRDVSASITANANDTIYYTKLRRVGHTVQLAIRIANSVANTAIELFAAGTGVPSGFYPESSHVVTGGCREDGTGLGSDGSLSVRSTGLTYYRVTTASYVNFTLTYLTSDAWPSSLPGSAA